MQFAFKVETVDIAIKSVSQPIRIRFFGDVHRDTDACDVGAWKSQLKSWKDNQDEYTYYVGMGDYHDFLSINEMKKIQAANLHETTYQTLENLARDTNVAFANEIKFMEGKMLGIIEGNHTFKYENGTDTNHELAMLLKTRVLGWLAFLRLNISRGNKKYPVYLSLCHGKAGGKLAGTTISQVDDLVKVFPSATIYAMGHDHAKGARAVASLKPKKSALNDKDGMVLVPHEQWLVRTGCFKRSYMQDAATYEAKKIMRPSTVGGVEVTISIPQRETTDTSHNGLVKCEIKL